MAILFFAFAIPDSLSDEISKIDRYPQVQGHKLQWNIIRGVEAASNTTIDLIGAIPVSNFPAYPKIFFGASRWSHGGDAEDFFLPYVNLALLKHVTRFLSSLVLVCGWLWKKRREKEKKVLIYAMHSPFMLSALLSTGLLGGQIYLVVPDMPQFMDLGMKRSLYRKIAKRLDAFLMHRMLRGMAGLIVLTQQVVTDMAGDAIPSIVVEGMVSPFTEDALQASPSSGDAAGVAETIVMYTGALTGLDLLLEAFAQIPDPRYRLWFSGRGVMEAEIKEAAARDSRIVYWGMLPTEELNRKTAEATVLIIPRSATTPYIQYSFPSKLLEYMMTGRPVISTVLPGIPAEYHDYLFLLRDETAAGLAKLLTEVCERPVSELSEFGLKARDFVIREKNYLSQGKRIFDFMQRK